MMDRLGSRQPSAMESLRTTTRLLSAAVYPRDFADLFEREFDYVWFTLRRFGVPERDLEDVAHDLFIHVHRHFAEFDPARPVRPWLFGFAYRIASDYRRLARHRLETLEERVEATDPAPSPAEHLVARQRVELAWEALEELEVDRRAVFLLHEIEGLPIREVSEILEVPLNTAYSRLRLAREQLAKALRRLHARRGEI
jgi:RNA polymerase sigma-70 factor, ECF subfamily